MDERPRYAPPVTSRKVKLLILGAAFVGFLLTVGQWVLFLTVHPFGGFPTIFDWWDKIQVTYENQTDVTVYIYLDNSLEATVPAHQSVTTSDRKLFWWIGRRIEARDAAGRVLFAIKLDDSDLKDRGYRVDVPPP